MLIQTQRWGRFRSNYSLTAISHPRPPPSLYRLSRWAAGLAKCDSNHLLLSWTSSISNWSATVVNVLSSWAHPHSSKPHIAFHYICRSNSDDLENISTCSNCSNVIIFCCLQHRLFSIGSQLLSTFWPYWTHLHSSNTHIAFHYNCRLNTDGLGHIFTGSNSGTTTGKLWITFSHFPIVATTATQTDLLGQLHIRCEEDSLHWNVAIFCENDLLTKMYLGHCHIWLNC